MGTPTEKVTLKSRIMLYTLSPSSQGPECVWRGDRASCCTHSHWTWQVNVGDHGSMGRDQTGSHQRRPLEEVMSTFTWPPFSRYSQPSPDTHQETPIIPPGPPPKGPTQDYQSPLTSLAPSSPPGTHPGAPVSLRPSALQTQCPIHWHGTLGRWPGLSWSSPGPCPKHRVRRIRAVGFVW